MSRGRAPRLEDVAREAGVSVSTASRALNGNPTVHPLLRQHVIAAARRVGYQPNALARGLRTHRTQTVGIVIPTIVNPHFTEAVQAAQDTLAVAGYATLVSNAARDPEAERRDLEVLCAGRVDGLVLAPTQVAAEQLAALIPAGLPVVLMDRRVPGAPWDWVAVDVQAGAYAAVAHLAARGRRRIGFIAGPPGISTADDKLAGYQQALQAYGLPDDPALVAPGDYTEAGGRAATADLLTRRPPPDALIAANNLSALGMVLEVRRRGLRIPDDLALVGFDDTAWTALMQPGLTVVAQPVAVLGATAAKLLLARLGGQAPPEPRHEMLPATLVVRGSS
jgi:LacI family transcriptional regulator